MARHQFMKRRRKRSSGQKVLRKPLGFSAFSTKRKSSKWSKLVEYKEAVSPETGIHSLEWAQDIVSQNSPLLRLPLEVRLRIWNLVIDDYSIDNGVIIPMKMGKKFKSPSWVNTTQEVTMLPETCRQMYVEVIGGGLLYKSKRFMFYFASPYLLLSYLWVINPAHKDGIRSIQLSINLNSLSTLPIKAFSTLADCKGLQHLTLVFHLGWSTGGWHFLLDKIGDCEALTRMKGLQSFQMIVPGSYDAFRGQDGPNPFRDLEDRLKLQLLAPRSG